MLALALAPLSLVQATAAGGIGILAVMVSRYTGVPLTPLEQVGSVLSVAGLAVLGISLAGNSDKGTAGSALAVGLWLAASGVATVLALRVGPRLIGGGPAYGVAAGILFAAGDVSTKTTVAGRRARGLRAGADRQLRARDAGPPAGLPAGERARRRGARQPCSPTRSRSRPG